MGEPMSAITAYRHPGKRVFWDEACTLRIGKMRMDDEGNLFIMRGDAWQPIEPGYILYAEVVLKAGKKMAKV